MLNLDLIDKLIAVVVILVALSLFVQSLQSLLKKITKIKSLQIELSLVHLFQYVLDKECTSSSNLTDNAPLIRMIVPGAVHPAAKDPQVATIYNSVVKEFKRIGRVTQKGKLMLDSISKDDIKKFLEKTPANEVIAGLYPNLKDKLAGIGVQFKALEDATGTIETTAKTLLNDDDRASIKALLVDLRGIVGGDSFSSQMLIADITKLEKINPEDVLKRIGDAQQKISEALEKAKKTPGVAGDLGLEAAQMALNEIAAVVEGFVAIRGVVNRIETWFDTVMQSFDERFNRSMKLWTLILSAIVVIVLNANIINIYRDISTNEPMRNAILQAAEDKYRKPSPAVGATPVPAGTAQTSPTATPTPADASKQESPEKLYIESRDLITKNVNDYTAMGFKGPDWIFNVPHWVFGTGFYADNPQLHPNPHDWNFRLRQASRTLVGWLIMMLLLSAGAPFWEDVLESLFGAKNLIRGKSGTKNVEKQSGEGQPKS